MAYLPVVDVEDRADRLVGNVRGETAISTLNSTSTPLSSAATFTGTGEDVSIYAALSINIFTDQDSDTDGLELQWSSDGTNWDHIEHYSLLASQPFFINATIRARYFRISLTNGATPQSVLRLQAIFSSIAPTDRKRAVQQTPTYNDPALTSRSVIFGANENGETFGHAGITERDALKVEIAGPVAAFGETVSTHLTPRIQIDAVYGLLDTDHETLVDASPGTGSATASGGLFVCQTGTGVGGYGVIRSRRLLRYRPGQGARFRFTALFTSPVASSLQLAGAFTATDGLFFGYSGTTFGVMRRIAGAIHIARLTVTNGATGVETITITLNGTAFVLPATGGALSTSATAEYIAEQTSLYTGWLAATSPTSNGATVTWLQNIPATAGGAFTLTSTGGATGSFSTVQAGVANDQATGFVAQSAWNVDVMDGSGSTSNPSGVLLDQTKLNVFQIVYPYLGAGTIRFGVMSPDGRFITVHRLRYPNSAVIANQRNPTLRLGWIAASLGSSTNLTVKGASAAAFVEGESTVTRDPFGASINGFSAGTTEYVAIALRVGGTFGSTVNQREILPQTLQVGTETSNRVVRVRCIRNPTLTGTVDWSYIDSTRSSVEQATPTTITPSGGITVAYLVSASGAPASVDLSKLDLRLEPGDVLAIALTTASASAVTTVSINWNEQ